MFSSWMEQDATNAVAIPKYNAKRLILLTYLPINIRAVATVNGFEVGLEK